MMLLLSGGLDSLAAWRLLGFPPAVRFDLGTRSSEREDAALAWASEAWGQTFTRRPLPMEAYERPNGYLPHRNALLVLAAAQMDPEVIVAQVAEWAPDKNPRFWRQVERLANFRGDFQGMGGDMRVRTPFASLTKGALLARYRDTFGREEARDLCLHTWSCYEGGDAHCGVCAGCAQRWQAEMRAFGRPMTTFQRTPRGLGLHGTWRDGLRWLRDGGRVGLRQVIARSTEAMSVRLARGL